jgi:uncharacterized spore protein YtfJ
VNDLKIINTLQRYVLSVVVAAMLLGLGACSGMSKQETQDKDTPIGGVIGDEVGKYKH